MSLSAWPVATTAAPPALASASLISGSGRARAKTMGSLAMLATISRVTSPPADSPMNTSAPLMTSARLPLTSWGPTRRAISDLAQSIPTGTVNPEGPVPVADDNVIIPGHHQAFGHAGAGHAGAVNHHAHVLQVLAHQLEGVIEGSQHNDSRGVVFVVQHRHPDGLPDPIFNGEAFGRGDAFQAEAPEGWGQNPDDLDDLVGVLGLQGDGDRIHVGKSLIDNRLGLQLGQHRHGPDIAELIHLAAVRDQGDGIAPAGIAVGRGGILVDFPADRPHPRGIDPAQHGDIPDGHFAPDSD